MDSRFKFWLNRGVTAYLIMKKNSLLSLQIQQEGCNLGKWDFLFQIFAITPTPLKWIQPVVKAYSALNHLFQNYIKEYLKVEQKKTWQMILNRNEGKRELPNRGRTSRTVFSTTSSAYWRLLTLGRTVCFFITPYMQRYQTSLPYSCWRKCGTEEENHHHIL